MHVSKSLRRIADTADAMDLVAGDGERRSACGWRPTTESRSWRRSAPTTCSASAVARRRSAARDANEYEARVASKRWRELWPKVRFSRLGSVENHHEWMMAAARWMKAAKLRSVLSQRMAMRFEFLELAEEVLDEWRHLSSPASTEQTPL